MTLVKAVLFNLDVPKGDENQEFKCLFNPSEYNIVVSNNWSPAKSMGLQVPKMNFTGGNSATLNLTLFFDVFEQPGESVLKYTDKLLKLTQILESTRNAESKQGRPPRCRLQWGDMYSFDAVVKSVNLKFTLFREDGTPVRATAGVSLVQAHEGVTKPPTRTPAQAGSVYKIKSTDTLSSIAGEVYKDPTAWRIIALANDLKDVINLKEGDELKIPALEDEDDTPTASKTT